MRMNRKTFIYFQLCLLTQLSQAESPCLNTFLLSHILYSIRSQKQPDIEETTNIRQNLMVKYVGSCLRVFFVYLQMGQNSSFHLGITDVIREWAPISKDSSIFINRNTRCHLQRFIVQIPLPELLRQVTIYNARIQAVHPFVCRIAYFNQIPSEDQNKGFRNFAVYTDHLMPIREDDWTLLRFAHALEAVLTLVGYYGFFRLTEKMMFANERGETKVWISHSPVHNHRDFVFTTEAQALFSIAEIATRRNKEVANILTNCATLQEGMEKLNKVQRTFGSPCEAVNNQAQQSRESRKDYKNVFHQQNKIDYINNQSKLRLPTSALFSNGKKEEFKPFSYGGNNQSALSGRTTSHYKKAKPTGSQFFLKKRPESKNIGETSFDNFAKLPKQQRSFQPVPHFKTTAQFSSKYQIPSPSSKQQAKALLFTPDITIINNNVSHVVNNITHNHSAWTCPRNPKTPQFVEEVRNESASQVKNKGKAEKVSAPKFIQQRKQEATAKNNNKSFYANSSEKSSGIINAPKSFFRDPPSSAYSSNNTNTQQSFKSAEAEWSKEPATRKPQKLYTFCRPINGKSPPKPFSNSFSPQGHAPFTPPANLHNTNNTSFFKKPSRTLTTQFNGPPPTASFIASNNKSFNFERQQKGQYFHYQSPTNSKIMKEKTAISQAIPEDAAEALPTSQSIPLNTTSGKSIESSLKQQLKLEFSSLLGTEPKIAQKTESAKETPPESNLKEKIQQKKIAFAQLKKQALAVLTDLL